MSTNAATLPAGASPFGSIRLTEPDVLRGLIMILMAIDHASFFIAHLHPFEYWGVPLPQYADTLSFITRWITHLCAPGFFFLMGLGMYMFAESRRKIGWSEWAISKHFIARGLILIVLEMFVLAPAWLLGPSGDLGGRVPGGGSPFFLYFGVLFGLGSVMIVCGMLLRFKWVAWVIVALVALLGSQYLMQGNTNIDELYNPILRLLLIPGHTNAVYVVYPLVPWLGIAIFGIIFGKLIAADRSLLLKYSAGFGVAALLLFLAIRTFGGFGNYHAVSTATWIEFLNVNKYPPSLAFVTLTMGINLLLLAVISLTAESFKKLYSPLIVFGQTAFFFYAVHLYLFGVIGLTITPKGGTSLPVMYIYWLGALAVLYFLCLKYRAFKQTKPADSYWRLF